MAKRLKITTAGGTAYLNATDAVATGHVPTLFASGFTAEAITLYQPDKVSLAHSFLRRKNWVAESGVAQVSPLDGSIVDINTISFGTPDDVNTLLNLPVPSGNVNRITPEVI